MEAHAVFAFKAVALKSAVPAALFDRSISANLRQV